MNKTTRKGFGVFLVLVIFGIAGAYIVLFKANTSAIDKDYFYIRHSDSYEQIRANLVQHSIVKNVQTFDLVAMQMNLSSNFKPGRYKIPKGLSNIELVQKLRQGKWEKVVIKIPIEMTRTELLDYLSENLEPDRDELVRALNSDLIKQNGFTSENKWCIFLPDHYYLNWASTADMVVNRFVNEYNSFWTASRLSKAKQLKMSSKEVTILASIVDGEAIHADEMPIIAGLYLNRLNKGQLLQSDPTILYAVGEKGRRRVLFADLRRAHPYNTYINVGLPPGPLFVPDKRAIDAVLNPALHDFIFMCAKPDGSYRHSFTASMAQHNRNAIEYRKSLDKKGVKR